MNLNANFPSYIRIRELLNASGFEGAKQIGGAGGAEKAVTEAFIVPDAIGSLLVPQHSVLIIDAMRSKIDSYLIDIVLRRAAEAKASGVIVAAPEQDIALAPRRLADRFDMPLISIHADAFTVLDTVRELATKPTRYFAELLVSATTALSAETEGKSIDNILAIIDRHLGSLSTISSSEGGVLAGEREKMHPRAFQPPTTYSTVWVDTHTVRLIQPISVSPGEVASFWLVTEKHSPIQAWLTVAKHFLTIAAQYLVVSMLTERLAAERDARHDLGVLNAIVSAEQMSPEVVQQVGILGWKVDGWCSAITVHLSGDQVEIGALSRSQVVADALHSVGVNGPIIQQQNGWTTWILGRDEPTPDSFRVIANRLNAALWPVIESRTQLRMSVGVGRPYEGLGGVRRSLLEASEASTIAQAGGEKLAVQHIDTLGIERVLYSWYSSAEFVNFSRTLLGAILRVDGGELVRTLEVYLDNESSATITADVLGVHRNTIINRTARIKELISIDLDDPDQRLAVQLACRVVNLHEPMQQ